MLVLLLTLAGQYLKGDLNLSFLFSGKNLKKPFMSYFFFLMVMVWTSAFQKIVDVIGDSNSNSGEKKWNLYLALGEVWYRVQARIQE